MFPAASHDLIPLNGTAAARAIARAAFLAATAVGVPGPVRPAAVSNVKGARPLERMTSEHHVASSAKAARASVRPSGSLPAFDRATKAAWYTSASESHECLSHPDRFRAASAASEQASYVRCTRLVSVQ